MNRRKLVIWGAGACLVAFGCANVVDETPMADDDLTAAVGPSTSASSTTSASATGPGSTTTISTATSSTASASSTASTTSAGSTTASTDGALGGTLTVTSSSASSTTGGIGGSTSAGPTSSTATTGGGAGGTGGETSESSTSTVGPSTSTVGPSTSTVTSTSTSTATSTSTSTTGVSNPGHCLDGWRDDPGADACLNAMQSNQRKCELLLDCYLDNDCGPTDSCATNPNEVCHINQLGADGAAQSLASSTYAAICG